MVCIWIIVKMKNNSNKLNKNYIGKNYYYNPYGIINNKNNYLNNLSVTRNYNWESPSDWLKLPGMTEGDQRLAILYGVYPGGSGATGFNGVTGGTASGNFVAFLIRGCTYVVDWGDGVTQSFSSGITATYNYDYASISSSTQTTSGFRQIVMQSYPETTGATFSEILINGRYPQGVTTFPAVISENAMSIKLSSPSLRRLLISERTAKSIEIVGTSGITNGNSMFSTMRACQQVLFNDPNFTANIIDFSNMFLNCRSLKFVSFFNASSGTNFSSMCSNCNNLETFPYINVTNGITFTSMFFNCSSLKNVPVTNLQNARNTVNMFNNCQSLTFVPELNTPLIINPVGMFSACSNIKQISNLSFPSATSGATMFSGCSSLIKVGNINMPVATNFTEMFFGCTSLKTVETIDTPAGITFNSMFANCYYLNEQPKVGLTLARSITSYLSGTNIPYINIHGSSLGVIANSAFSDNFALRKVLFSPSMRLTNPSSMFNNCRNLKEIKGLTGCVTMLNSNIVSSLSNLKNAILPGITLSVSYMNCNLSAAALNDVFTYLGNATATITITNNWGANQCNRSIATSKGWTVTG